MAEEEKSRVTASPKDYVLTQLERLLFNCGMLLYAGRYVETARALDIIFRLLPPENRAELREEREFLDSLKQQAAEIPVKEPFLRLSAETRLYTKHSGELMSILERVQDSLYRKHLRAGYTGIDLRGEGGDYDVQLEPEEPEKNAD
jgi:hypothetical protein